MPQGISIHIGLNEVDPAHYNGWSGKLNACEADAGDMERIATARGFEPTTILTREGTADAVTSAISDAAGKLEAGDILFLTYSGHGGQVPDTNNDEEQDQLDETWVLFDRQLVDDELYDLYSQFAAGTRIFVFSDSCHSGSVNRGIFDVAVPARRRRGDGRHAGAAHEGPAAMTSPSARTSRTRTSTTTSRRAIRPQKQSRSAQA